MKLYFDIGNTNIKLNFEYEGTQYYLSYKTKQEYTPDSFFNQLPDLVKNAKIEKIFICSVVPVQKKLIEGTMKKYFQIRPIIISHPIKTGIKLKAADPKSVGADLVALAAFISSKSTNAIMINLGTATTITYVTNKTLQGIIIIPGIHESFNSLINGAAKLAEINLVLPDKKMGNTTSEALSLGLLKGHIHMIRGFIREIDSSADIFISGGNSKLIKDYINATYVKEATIEGMKVIEKFNET